MVNLKNCAHWGWTGLERLHTGRDVDVNRALAASPAQVDSLPASLGSFREGHPVKPLLIYNVFIKYLYLYTNVY